MGDVVVDIFDISPDRSRVIYLAEQTYGGSDHEIFSASITGPAGAAIKLNTLPEGLFAVRDFQISPDGSRVVFRTEEGVRDHLNIYSIPVTGPPGSGVLLNGLQANDRMVRQYGITSDGAQVIFLADLRGDDIFEIFSVSITGPAGVDLAQPISGDLVSTGSVDSFVIVPDSRNAVYRADQDTPGVFELYITGYGNQVLIPMLQR
jgi:hypothetical protein